MEGRVASEWHRFSPTSHARARKRSLDARVSDKAPAALLRMALSQSVGTSVQGSVCHHPGEVGFRVTRTSCASRWTALHAALPLPAPPGCHRVSRCAVPSVPLGPAHKHFFPLRPLFPLLLARPTAAHSPALAQTSSSLEASPILPGAPPLNLPIRAGVTLHLQCISLAIFQADLSTWRSRATMISFSPVSSLLAQYLAPRRCSELFLK